MPVFPSMTPLSSRTIAAPYYALIADLRVLFNRDARGIAELEKIEGIQLSVQLREGSFWSGRSIEERAVEIAVRIPPGGLLTECVPTHLTSSFGLATSHLKQKKNDNPKNAPARIRVSSE